MPRIPLRPGQGEFPKDQVSIPTPPSDFSARQCGVLRRPPKVTVAESYLQNTVRVWPDGLEQPAKDLVPSPGADHQSPSSIFGPDVERVFIVSGVKAFGRLTTRVEDAESLLRFHWRLDWERWNWRPTVTASPDRQWVEGGALLLDYGEEQVTSLAFHHGQYVVLRWDDEGMAPIPTMAGIGPGAVRPVPVLVVPARTGCPLRNGADGACKTYGGPWTSSSIAAALIWKNHREMLLDAFGCDVCKAQGAKGARGAVELFSPSREGGWQRAAPMTLGMMLDDR